MLFCLYSQRLNILYDDDEIKQTNGGWETTTQLDDFNV